MDYTNNALISQIKTRITVPTDQNLFNTQRFLDILNNQLQTRVVPKYLELDENYFIEEYTFNTVSGQSEYALPVRTFGNMLDSLLYKTVPNTDDNDSWMRANYISPNDYQFASIDSAYWSLDSIGGLGVFFKRDKINIRPTPTSAYPIKMRFTRRCGILVDPAECAQVTTFDNALYTVDVSVVPTGWGAATIVDAIKGNPQFDPIANDKVITSIALNQIQFDATNYPAGIAVGDWLTLQYTSPIAQIPYDAFYYLSSCASLQCAIALGDTEIAGVVAQDLSRIENAMTSMATPRITKQVRKATRKAFC